ncbi:ABC-three component system protein [Niabella insulamsoli]|uniref:ABC-three component system protein n=1 Tax=Niabella insulamsoli TaxID=3144874 RepID=UPI0031FCDB35
MADLAPGPMAGYLFQFEKALSLLASLENSSEAVSVEVFDDVAIQDGSGLVILSLQAKHSISPNGTTFEDTSVALWRTLQIWIQKLKDGTFTRATKFVCATNKRIDKDALLRKITILDFDTVKAEINDLLTLQKEKLKSVIEKGEKGPSIKKNIELIQFALDNLLEFEIVKNNLSIEDNITPQQKFFVSIHMANKAYSDEARSQTFETMYGWIIKSSKAKWLNSEHAVFTKQEFETRLSLCFKNPSIINALFRAKKKLGSLDSTDVDSLRKELFIKQIEDIKRNKEAVQRKIDRAISDYFCHGIEMSYIITQGNLTKEDFDEFAERCFEKWQICFDAHVTKDLEDYSENEKNQLAITIFDFIMETVEIKFQDGIDFTSDNKYIHNGTFLNLSNLPKIGWHPEWESKYARK